MNFGDRLRDLRDERGLKQQNIADLLNVSRSAVTQYETNRAVPEHGKLRILADYFNVSIDYLLGRTEQRQEIVHSEGNLHPDNIRFKKYDEVMIALENELIRNGIIEQGEPIPDEILNLIITYGKEPAKQIILAKKQGKSD